MLCSIDGTSSYLRLILRCNDPLTIRLEGFDESLPDEGAAVAEAVFDPIAGAA